jgi:hypothetical protein
MLFLFSFSLVTNGAGMSIGMGKATGGVFWESRRAILRSTLRCFGLLCAYIQYLDRTGIIVYGRGEENVIMNGMGWL